MANKNVNVKLGANITDFQSKMKLASKGFKKTAAALKKTGKALTMGLTAPMLAFAGASVKAFDTQAKAEAKLNTALKGNQKAFKSLTAQARELQKVTIFGDEETIAAQSMLASMGLEEEAIMRLTPLIQDMATAKGMNLSAAADLVAKSVGSSTNALSRYGIQIDGAVGSTDRLDSAVLALKGQFDGQAKAAAKAGAGPLKQLSNRFGDLMEKIGEMLIPIMNSLVGFIDDMITSWNNLDSGLKIAIVTFVGILAAIGPVLTIFGTLVSVVGFFMSPLGAVIAALAALSAAAIYVADNLDAFKETGAVVFAKLQNAVIDFLQFFIENNPFALIIDGYNLLMDKLGREGVENPFSAVSGYLEDLKMDIPEVSAEFGSFGDAVSNAATKAKNALFGLGDGLGIGNEFSAEQGGGGSDGGSSDGGSGSGEGEGNKVVAELIKIKDVATSVSISLAQSFSQSFASLVVSGQGMLKGLTDIFANLARQFAAMIIQAATLAAIMTLITGGSFAGAATAKGTNFASRFMGGLTGRASGGAVISGTPYIVGEQGPELFMPGQSGTIIPNNNVGGGNITGQFVVQGTDLVAAINNQLESDYGSSVEKL